MVIGGYGRNEIDLINLQNGNTCNHLERTRDSYVYGEGAFINNTAVYWNEDKFFKWNGSRWVQESQSLPFNLTAGSSVLLPNGNWMVFVVKDNSYLQSAIYDGQSGDIVEGPTLDFHTTIGANPCVTMISNTTLGIITEGGRIYTYDLLTKYLWYATRLPEGWYSKPAAQCHTLIHNNVPTGIDFSWQFSLIF